MSSIRKRYFLRLYFRIAVLIFCLVMCFVRPQMFYILEGFSFFEKLSPFHFLWLIWIVDMVQQIIPVKSKIALGSQKLFANRFKPIREKMNRKALKDYIISTTNAAYMMMILWVLLTAAIGGLYFWGIIGKIGLFMFSVVFYVCDLICVLIWCPFRLIMKNKCCTTCRIFNWDHLMMFSPLVFMGGFFGLSLFIMSLLAWLVWEIAIMLYPERFWEMTNASLKCAECTDKLCTQYCQRLRSPKNTSINK